MVGIIVELHINFFAYNKTFLYHIRILFAPPSLYKYYSVIGCFIWFWILMESGLSVPVHAHNFPTNDFANETMIITMISYNYIRIVCETVAVFVSL